MTYAAKMGLMGPNPGVKQPYQTLGQNPNAYQGNSGLQQITNPQQLALINAQQQALSQQMFNQGQNNGMQQLGQNSSAAMQNQIAMNQQLFNQGVPPMQQGAPQMFNQPQLQQLGMQPNAYQSTTQWNPALPQQQGPKNYGQSQPQAWGVKPYG